MTETASTRVNRGLSEIGRDLAARLKGAAGEPVAFSLFVWPIAAEATASYVSNVNRSEAHFVVGTFVTGWQAGVPDTFAPQEIEATSKPKHGPCPRCHVSRLHPVPCSTPGMASGAFYCPACGDIGVVDASGVVRLPTSNELNGVYRRLPDLQTTAWLQRRVRCQLPAPPPPSAVAFTPSAALPAEKRRRARFTDAAQRLLSIFLLR